MKLFESIKKAKKAVDNRIIFGYVLMTTPLLSYAQNSGSIAGFNTAKQTAGSKKLDDVAQNVDRLAGNTYNTINTIAILLGVFLVAISLWGFYKSSKDERETPKSAIVGLIIGGMMTAVGIVTAMSANTTTG